MFSAELLRDRDGNMKRTNCLYRGDYYNCYMLSAKPKSKTEWEDIYADIIAENVDCLDDEKAAKSVIEEYMWSMRFCDEYGAEYYDTPIDYNMSAVYINAKLKAAARDLSSRLQEITTVLI